MPTVIFYCSILLFSTLFIYLRERGKGKFEYYFFTTLAFLLVFIPSAIRYDIGTDYLSYQNIYFNLEYYSDKEIGFYYINSLLRSLHADVQWMFAVFALIFTALCFSSYPKKYAWLFHLVLICVLWFPSFNIMRQTTAMAFCLLAVVLYLDKKYIKFFILAFIGFLFHKSALFIILAGVASLIPLAYSLKTKVLPNFFIGGVIFTFISSTIVMLYIEQVLNILGMVKYASYFNNSRHFVEKDYGSGIVTLIKCSFVIFTIYKSKMLIDKNKNYWFIIVLCFLYGVGIALANNIIIFGRMADTFSMAVIFSVYLLYKYESKNLVTKWFIYLFVLCLMLTFAKMGFGEETSYTNPKRNPYVTIFSK